jgi:WhiB family redox-sensing transcriptional regulator
VTSRALLNGCIHSMGMTTVSEQWLARAACTGAPPHLFFPEDGDSGTAGKAICATCPVQQPCLDFAREHRIVHGTWGGRTARERTRPKLVRR